MGHAGRIKLLHFISDPARSEYFRCFADHIDRSRFDMRVVTLQPEGPLQEDMRARGIPTLALGCTRRTEFPEAILRVGKLLKQESVDVLQVHLFDASVVGLTAARFVGTPVTIFSGHHSRELMMNGKKLPLLADLLCTRTLARHVISPSVEMKEHLVSGEGVPAGKIVVIPHPFDLERLRPSPDARTRVRSELGLGEGPVFCAVGRLTWVKNYPALFRSFATVCQQVPDARLVVLGSGPDREQLEQLAKDLGVAEAIVFAGYRGDLPDVFAASDVFVHASNAESFGQVLIEAMAQGKPIITTKVGIAREALSTPGAGLLVDPGDEPGLLAAMTELCAARPRWAEMGREARRRAERFSAERVIREHEAQYVQWLMSAGRYKGHVVQPAI